MSNMAFGRAIVDGAARVVVVDEDRATMAVAHVAGESFHDLPELLVAADGNISAVDAGHTLSVATAELLAPVRWPKKIICVGQNYAAHAAETGKSRMPDYPDLFCKWDTALAAPQADLPLPPESDQVDYEAELAVIIGRSGRRVAREQAAHLIFGYTCANDGSVRDFQFHSGQRTAGKAWDRLTPLGPVVMPSQRVGGAHPQLEIRGILNSVTVQSANTRDLHFDVPSLIEYITTFMTLAPGDIILTGTPAGVGLAESPPRYMRDGDEFEVSIAGIGRLQNRYTREKIA